MDVAIGGVVIADMAVEVNANGGLHLTPSFATFPSYPFAHTKLAPVPPTCTLPSTV